MKLHLCISLRYKGISLYSQQKHTTWAGHGWIIIAQSYIASTPAPSIVAWNRGYQTIKA